MLGKRGHHVHAAASTLGVAVLQANICDLKTAIVHRACVDYLNALRDKTHERHDKLPTREQLEKFFHSAWFSVLCDADADALLYELRRLSKAGKKSINYGVYSNSREEQ